MRNFSYLIPCLMMIASLTANGQNKTGIQGKNNLYDFFYRNIKRPQTVTWDSVLTSVIVKIHVSSTGEVNEINFSETTNAVKNEITRVIKLNGAEAIFKNTPNTTLTIPVIFHVINMNENIKINYNEMFDKLMIFLDQNHYEESKGIKYFPPLVVKLYTFGRTIQ